MTSRVFISHAGEDKEHVARPLAAALRELGHDVWYDEYSLEIGDSLREEIDKGLRDCDFGVVILSPAFFGKSWPRRELDGLFSLNILEHRGNRGFILPVWHALDREAVANYAPTLAGRLAVTTDEGVELVVDRLHRAIVKRQGQIAPAAQSLNAQAFADVEYLLQIRVAGRKLQDLVLESFSAKVGIARAEIHQASLLFYDDGSGLDPVNSTIEFGAGHRWRIVGDPIGAVIGAVTTLPGWLPGAWMLPDEVRWRQENEAENKRLSLVETEVDVIWVRDPSTITQPARVISFLYALTRYMGTSESTVLSELWWEPTSPGYRLIECALSRGLDEELVKLLDGIERTDYRAFLLGRTLVQVFVDAGLGGRHPRLVKRLLQPSSPLNDYWHERLLVATTPPSSTDD